MACRNVICGCAAGRVQCSHGRLAGVRLAKGRGLQGRGGCLVRVCCICGVAAGVAVPKLLPDVCLTRAAPKDTL